MPHSLIRGNIIIPATASIIIIFVECIHNFGDYFSRWIENPGANFLVSFQKCIAGLISQYFSSDVGKINEIEYIFSWFYEDEWWDTEMKMFEKFSLKLINSSDERSHFISNVIKSFDNKSELWDGDINNTEVLRIFI